MTNAAVFDVLARRSRQRLRAAFSSLRHARPDLGPSIYLIWRYAAPPRRAAQAASLALDLADAATAALLAEDAYNRARTSDPLAFVLAAEVLADQAELLGEFDRAEALLAELADPAFVAVAPGLWSRALTRRARLDLLRNGPEAAAAKFKAAEAAACEAKDDKLQAVLSDLRGTMCISAKDLRSACKTFEMLRATGDRLGDLAILAAAETGLARVARAQGKARHANAAILRALRFARVAGDGHLLQDALGVAAKIYIEAGDFDEATEFVVKRRTLTKELGDLVGQVENEADWARICAHVAPEQIARRVIQNALELIETYDLPILRDHLLSALSTSNYR